MKIVLYLYFIITLSSFGLGVSHKKSKIILKGTTLGKYAKTGALVDISYTTQQIEKGEICDVNITLSSKSKDGELYVWLRLDENLEVLDRIEKKYKFLIDKTHQSFSLNFSLNAKNKGIFYIRLQTELNMRMRAFGIPIYVGTFKEKSKSIQKTKSGQKISVSSARETIR